MSGGADPWIPRWALENSAPYCGLRSEGCPVFPSCVVGWGTGKDCWAGLSVQLATRLSA